MFAKATSNFVSEIDPEGYLIPVCCLNNSDKLVPLSLVVKRKRFWFWKRPKYLPSDFTLNDVLTTDKPINPVVVETDFLKYTGTFGDNIAGKVEAGFGPTNINVEGKGSSKLESSFGSLKKQEVDVQKLLRDSKDQVLDLEHCLIQQTREKRNEVFGIVKERILTTQPCTVTEEVQEEGKCGGSLGFSRTRKIQVSVKPNGNLQSDSNVSLEIPAHTVIAYSLIELEVKRNGHYELCLQQDTLGGFEEVDCPVRKDLVTVSGAPAEAPINLLQKELEKLQGQFQLLSDLPAHTRSSLFQLLVEIMEDRAALGVLQSVLDERCLGKKPSLSELQEVPSLSKQTIQSTLDLLLQAGEADQIKADDESAESSDSPSLLTATHLLISAMDEMTDAGLSALGSCCSPPILQALPFLVQSLTGSRKSSLKDVGLAPLAEEEAYKKVHQLFGSSNVTLRKEEGTLCTGTSHQPGHLPLIMCITVKGLASLGN